MKKEIKVQRGYIADSALDFGSNGKKRSCG